MNKDRNFGQDSTDFSKTNVSVNMGYLAASQANIVQAQSVRLLS
jgi:flagellin